MTEMDDQQRLKAIQHSMVPRIRTEGADSKQAPHTPLKHESRLRCAGCHEADGWCGCPDWCDCLSCLNAELLEALKAIAQIGGNLPDERLTDRTGPNDAAQRGLMYCHVRQIANAAIARAEGKEQAR